MQMVRKFVKTKMPRFHWDSTLAVITRRPFCATPERADRREPVEATHLALLICGYVIRYKL